MKMESPAARVDSFVLKLQEVRDQMSRVIVGYEDVIDKVLACLLSGGNVLLEGLPGLGKTTLLRALGQIFDLTYSRVQFTPDLMPADIVGTYVMMGDDGGQHLQFRKGPVFTNLLLADEINRATPKTQSALLESMEEHSVTVGGNSHRLQEPFFVMATQNPIEQEGTYELPDAQLDKFMFKLIMDFPSHADLREIIRRTTGADQIRLDPVTSQEEVLEMCKLVREIPVADHVQNYGIRLVRATEAGNEESTQLVRQTVKSFASPRAAQALILAGKVRALSSGNYQVSCADIRDSFLPALRHRIRLRYLGEGHGVSVDDVLRDVLERTPEMA
jgi:MoxR-like ATPase